MRMAMAALTLFLLWPPSMRATESKVSHPGEEVTLGSLSRRILVRYKSGVPASHVQSAARNSGARLLRSYRIVENLHALEAPPDIDPDAIISTLRKDPHVLYAERDQIRLALETTRMPNDPQFPTYQWSLHSTAASGPWFDVDIDAPEAWDVATGSGAVVVAVIDTGITYTHADLAENIWINAGEVPDDGVDNDGNGYVDDLHGIDAVDSDSDPMDTSDCGHGTHAAGVIGAVTDNGVGIAGISWHVSLMGLRGMKSLPELGACGGPDSALIECLEYTVTMKKEKGVNIVATNNSWGGGDYGQALDEAIEATARAGILFVAAAGNRGLDNDLYASFPSDSNHTNVISVLATDRYDARYAFSNRGAHTVHLGAPGQDIRGTSPTGYSSKTGTSAAAAHVTGVAALLKALEPDRDWASIKNQIVTSGDVKPGVSASISKKRLNARGALDCVPGPATSLNGRIRPTTPSVIAAPGESIELAMQSVRCGSPDTTADHTVLIDGGAELVNLRDNGESGDEFPADGVFAATWTAPQSPGVHELGFPGGDRVTVNVPRSYHYSIIPFTYEPRGPVTYIPINPASSGGKADEKFGAWAGTPFPIMFGGQAFDSLTMSDNGQLSMGSGRMMFGSANPPLPHSQVDNVIAPFMDNLMFLSADNGGVELWNSVDSPRHFVIQWVGARAAECASGTGIIKFQVVFTESSSDILFNYDDVWMGGSCGESHNGGGSATVGIQVGRSTASQFSYLQPNLHDGMSILWSLDCPAITITPEALGGALLGQPYEAALAASGGGPPYAFSVTAGTLPAGLSLDGIAGLLAGIPSNSGAFSFTVTATDATGCTGSRDYTIQVEAPCPAISIRPTEIAGAIVGSSYSQVLSAEGGTPPYNFSIASGSLLAGFVLDGGTGTISGLGAIPEARLFVVRAEDAGGCAAEQAYVLDVNQAGCPVIGLGPASLPDASLGEAYDVALEASGGAGPHSFSIVGGTLPTGLNMTPEGHISGLPASPGTFRFAVSATDSTGCTGSRVYTIAIPAPAGLPDLRLALLRGPTLLRNGTTVKARFAVENAGTTLAARSIATVYLSPDPVLDPGDVVIQTYPVQELLPGDRSGGFKLRHEGRRSLKGKHIIFLADSGLGIQELDETNNLLVRKLGARRVAGIARGDVDASASHHPPPSRSAWPRKDARESESPERRRR